MSDTEPGSLPNPSNLAFSEELFEQFVQDPSSVPSDWRNYFQTLANGSVRTYRSQPSFKARSIFNREGAASILPHTAQVSEAFAELQDRVDQLIRAFRTRGHMAAKLDPLGRIRARPPELEASYYGFTEEHMSMVFSCETVDRIGRLPLRDIIDRLHNTYCRSIGVEYMHIADQAIRRWLQHRMEETENRLELSRNEQLRILTRLTDAVVFEEFIHKKFIGAKSFSLEGCESLIPLLDLAIEKAGEHRIEEIVFGMAHRGRLNVLANIMGKCPSQIFREFADTDPDRYEGRGDVKYHLGYSNDWLTESGQDVHLSLCFNPSHLEYVNPVVAGRVRAKQDRREDAARDKVMGLMIHGDAAFIGEGVVQETLNLSQLEGYATGGTLHIIVNNQIGFTTSPEHSRSTVYASDVAKMLQIPIFHVNGEDPEAVAQVIRLAMDYRKEFKRDLVIDMYGYRRLGHNESDEPAFTQPVLYDAIGKRKPVREGYVDHLLKLHGVSREEADGIVESRRELLEKELSESRSEDYSIPEQQRGPIWHDYHGGPITSDLDVSTGCTAKKLKSLLKKQTKLPSSFTPHPKIAKLMDHRLEMAEGKQPLDWAAAEYLAMATILNEGHRIRLSGQDCGRGTFSHRHAVLHDVTDGHTYAPLENLSKDQAPIELINSPLSEAGVLGFDYGYSLDWPKGLIIWEAQFGDFANAAQVIIDQFITSAEDKWQIFSGLVMLLPHGFEGQGPEHSSARLERWLTLAAEDNIQVVQPTTPAQLFHMLRLQALRKLRKPMVVMTPKSLLRHPRVISNFDELAKGGFQRVIPDTEIGKKATRILLCSGKVYYELVRRREDIESDEVAILRLEQLYPLPEAELTAALSVYKKDTPVYWVQDEPRNMGAWSHLRVNCGERLLDRHPLRCVCRPASASPATGSASAHRQEQARLLDEAFA